MKNEKNAHVREKQKKFSILIVYSDLNEKNENANRINALVECINQKHGKRKKSLAGLPWSHKLSLIRFFFQLFLCWFVLGICSHNRSHL